MGDLRPENGGEMPDDGHSGNLSGFPPEWGTIVIPDDASELDPEAEALRRELRRQQRRGIMRTRLGLAPGDGDGPSLGVPIIVMAVAVITTLLSLFVVTWDRSRVASVPPTATGNPTPIALSDVELADAGGDRVRLRGILPAVLLLADGCECSDLIAALAAAAPPLVTIVPIGRTAPCPVGGPTNVRCLADPTGTVTSRFAAAQSAAPSISPPPPQASAASPEPSPRRSAPVVLVGSGGNASAPTIIDSVDDILPDLNSLG